MLESRDERSKTAARAARGRGTRAVRLCWLAPLFTLLLSPALGMADDTADRVRDARRALQQGRYDEAMKAFRELERRRADTAAVAIGESQCQEARGEWKPATDLLAAAVKRLATRFSSCPPASWWTCSRSSVRRSTRPGRCGAPLD